jgi:hypothetical protein
MVVKADRAEVFADFVVTYYGYIPLQDACSQKKWIRWKRSKQRVNGRCGGNKRLGVVA